MAGPSWLAGTFAAVMIVIAAYSAGRLVFSRLRGRATESTPMRCTWSWVPRWRACSCRRLSLLPGQVWTAVFVMAAGWFGWHAIRGRGLGASGASRCRYPVPHLIECAAMLYMLLPRPAPGPGTQGPGWPWPAWAHPPAQRPASPHSRSSSPCSCSATSCGPPTGWPPSPGPEPPQQTRASPAIPGPRSRPPRLRAATNPASAPATPSASATRPGPPPPTRPQARRLLQDRDEHRHGLHAHPHALGRLSGTRQRASVAGQPSVTSVPPRMTRGRACPCARPRVPALRGPQGT